jgi:hypothetical protein
MSASITSPYQQAAVKRYRARRRELLHEATLVYAAGPEWRGVGDDMQWAAARLHRAFLFEMTNPTPHGLPEVPE